MLPGWWPPHHRLNVSGPHGLLHGIQQLGHGAPVGWNTRCGIREKVGVVGVLAKRRRMEGTAARQLLEDVASRLGGGIALTAAVVRSRPWRKPATRHLPAALLAAVATEIGLRTIQ